MKQREWKAKAEEFLRGARLLLANREYSSAYYLAGLTVECALKAKIASRFLAHDIPEKRLVLDVYDHDLQKLLVHAQLSNELQADGTSTPRLSENWSLVKTWTVNARYGIWLEAQASDMVRSISERGTGLLPWIKRRW